MAQARGRLLTAVATAGALDVASFLAVRRREIFKASGGRAAGSVAGLVLWSSLAGTSVLERVKPEDRALRSATSVLAVVCGAGNLALMGVHLKVHRGQRRALVGGLLGLAALRSGLHR
jgi:hypothetical protein